MKVVSNFTTHPIFIDIIEKKDTIRVYNAHFESFKVDVNSLNTDLTTIKNVTTVLSKTCT